MIIYICPEHGSTATDISGGADKERFCLVADKYTDICGKTCEALEVVPLRELSDCQRERKANE